MQLTLKLIEDAILRGWANTAHLSEICDCLRDEAYAAATELATDKIDVVYSERNSLAVALAKVTLLYGGQAGRGYDDSSDKAWDDDWRHVVYVEVPGVGQVSWHMGPNDLPRIESLPQYGGEWDGTCLGKDPSWPDTITSTESLESRND